MPHFIENIEPLVVEAEQWLPSQEKYLVEVAETSSVHEIRRGFVATPTGMLTINEGDWLVRYPGKTAEGTVPLRVLTDEEFRAAHSPHASPKAEKKPAKLPELPADSEAPELPPLDEHAGDEKHGKKKAK